MPDVSAGDVVALGPMTSDAIDRVLRLADLDFRVRVLMLREYGRRIERQD